MTSDSSENGVDRLPTIDDAPGVPVVIYDGHCAFCRDQVRRLHRWSGKRLAFVSLHDPIVSQRFPELSHDALMQQMYVVSPDGRAHGGADAIRFLSRYLPKLWWLCPLVHIPFSRPLVQWGYDWIARRRYQISGRTDNPSEAGCESGACQVHFRNPGAAKKSADS